MSEVTTTISKFVKEVIAKLSGDTDTAIALKNERLAKANIKGQISALEGALVEAEVNVESARDALSSAIYPTVLINNTNGYYKNIIGSQEILNEAEAKLKDIQDSIKYAETLLKERF